MLVALIIATTNVMQSQIIVFHLQSGTNLIQNLGGFIY